MKKESRYTFWSNSKYILDCICKWHKKFLFIAFLSVLVNSISVFIMPVFVKLIIAAIEEKNQIDYFLILVAIYLSIMLIVYMCNNYCECQNGWRFPYVVNLFRKQLLNTMITMDYSRLERPETLSEFEKNKNNLADSTKSVQGMMKTYLKVGASLFQVVFASFIISTLNPLLIVIVFLISILQFIPGDRTKKKDKEQVWDQLPPYWRKIFNYNYWSNSFQYAKDIRIFNMSEWLNQKHMDVVEADNRIVKKSRDLWIRCHLILKFLRLVQEAILYTWLVYNIINGDVSISSFTLYISSVEVFANALGQAFWEISNLRNQSKEVTDFRLFLDNVDGNKDQRKESAKLDEVLKSNKLDFTFENVSFKYSGQNEYALKNINLTISSKERLAIVGVNGAGKTTLVKLLCRLYEPTEGKILLNGKDIREFNREEYMRIFSPVFQNVEIYAFSVAENVAMNCDVNHEKLYDALRKVHLSEKVSGLEKAEDTPLMKILYEDGVDFSGGEKQKLAIARALYKDAPFIILDEPTAALDAIAEYKLYQAFDELIEGKTAIYISHRLSSTSFCNHIAMFDGGKIIEYGSHEELLCQNGSYAKLYNIQAQYYRDEQGGT